MNQTGNRGEDAPEPVRIYMDDQVIYENDKVWEFGVAPDGSSFFVVEPLGGRMSRLVVSNLDEAAEWHHDIGEVFAPEGNHVPYSAFYTLSGKELHLRPSDETGAGLHYFFSVSGGLTGAQRLRKPSGSGRRQGVWELMVSRLTAKTLGCFLILLPTSLCPTTLSLKEIGCTSF